MYDLNETIELMTSADYKDRFKAEYWQTKIRRDKLALMVERYNAGELDFKPTCPIDILATQLAWMGMYLSILGIRADLEGIDLNG